MGMKIPKDLEADILARADHIGEKATIPLPEAKGVVKERKGMNKTEAQYQLHLEDRKARKEILAYWYEFITFVLAFDCRWTPDFAVMLPGGVIELHDTKGAKKNDKGEWVPWIEEDAKVKLHIAGSHFPFPVRSVWFDKSRGEWMSKEYRK
jgi:hypothetical protein